MNKYRFLTSAFIAGIFLLLVGCKSAGFMTTWANGYQPLNARFAKIAVITDFAEVVNLGDKTVIPIDQSLNLARAADGQLVQVLENNKYEVTAHGRFMIGSYAVQSMYLSDTKENEPVAGKPPFHIDPDINNTKAFREVALTAMRAFAAMAVGGDDAIKDGALYPNIAKEIASRYNADSFALILGVVRNAASTGTEQEKLTSSRLYHMRAPVLCIGIFHGSNGKMLWYGSTSFESKVNPAAIKATVRQMTAELPPKGDGPFFVVPKLEKKGRKVWCSARNTWRIYGYRNPTQLKDNTRVDIKHFENAPLGRLVGKFEITIYRRPGLMGDMVDTFREGTNVRVINQQGEWFEIVTPDGQHGWVIWKWLRVQCL